MKLKPFLGIDITHNKKNTNYNGDVFIVDRATLAETASLDEALENATDVEKKAQLPWALTLIKLICELMGLICGFMVLGGFIDSELTFAERHNNAPWMVWCAVIGLLGWVVLGTISKKKQKTVYESPETENAQTALTAAAGDIYERFNVPADAPYVDILSFCYKIKDGEAVHKERATDLTSHINYATRVFIEGENLILADRDSKFAFPLDSLRKIHTVKKRISIPVWTKDTPYNEGEYKQYKMTVNQFGSIFMKTYHILELDRNGVAWGIYFPCYELRVIENITGLTAEAEE